MDSPHHVFREALAATGDRIAAIRTIRERFGLDLRQAKEVMLQAERMATSLDEHEERLAGTVRFALALRERLQGAVALAWPEQTLTQIEGDDWGEPTFPSYVVTNSHRLRHKPLCEFTAEDLRFMIGQQISLPILMPMALDVLELVNPFAGGDMNHGTLLRNALTVEKQFWHEHSKLWYRMNVVLVDLYSFREFIDKELIPAAQAFNAEKPVTEESP